MIERLRLWLTMRLLSAAWVTLPRTHPAWKGIFDAAKALRNQNLSEADCQRLAALEREHFGDPDKETGIYSRRS